MTLHTPKNNRHSAVHRKSIHTHLSASPATLAAASSAAVVPATCSSTLYLVLGASMLCLVVCPPQSYPAETMCAGFRLTQSSYLYLVLPCSPGWCMGWQLTCLFCMLRMASLSMAVRKAVRTSWGTWGATTVRR